jgi:DNA-binding IclR family transcriptional regulator
MTQPLPPRVLQLLVEDLVTLEQLETLRLLAESPQRCFSAAEAARALGFDEARTESALAHLQARGFLAVAPEGRRWGPARPEILAAVSELLEACRTNRAALLDELSARAVERIRNSTLRAFLDAFRMRRRGDG